MQMQPESVNTELETRKPWVEPEFEVLGAEDARGSATPFVNDGINYS